jgi:hypothetical protein
MVYNKRTESVQLEKTEDWRHCQVLSGSADRVLFQEKNISMENSLS